MISMIVAKGRNNEIGYNNKLLCHLSEDLKRFKEITLNKTIIMGRKTFKSLPNVLPNRKHIILSNNKDFFIDDSRVQVESEIMSIYNNYKNSEEEVFIIGGAAIFNYFYPLADKLYLTCIEKEFIADTYFPEIDLTNWTIEEKSDIIFSDNNIPYYYLTLKSSN